MNVITEIYRNSIQPSENSMKKDKSYKRAKNQVKQYYEILKKRLSEKDMLLLDKLLSSYDIKTERKNIYCFQFGFRIALESAIDTWKWER